jgi:aspartate/methionine/tyrosine aminotransferase
VKNNCRLFTPQVVLTTPSNPAGLVWGQLEMVKLIDMCKVVGSWVVVDQVYHEFLFDGAGVLVWTKVATILN